MLFSISKNVLWLISNREIFQLSNFAWKKYHKSRIFCSILEQAYTVKSRIAISRTIEPNPGLNPNSSQKNNFFNCNWNFNKLMALHFQKIVHLTGYLLIYMFDTECLSETS